MTNARVIARRARLAAATLAVLAAACGGGGRAPIREEAREFVHVHGLAVDPLRPDVLWVATHRGLIEGTNDSVWTYASEDRNDHMGFTVDLSTGTLFRSGHPEAGGTLGVESSTDGRTWQRIADVLDPPADFHAMTASVADPRTMYGWDSGGRGLFRSTDAGRSWVRLSPRGLPLPVLSLCAPIERDVVYAGTAAGLFRSEDGGGTWAGIGGLGAIPVTALGCDPKFPSHLILATQEGVRVSVDRGAAWMGGSGIPASQPVGAIAVSRHDGKVAYASAATTVYKSTDGGESWQVVRSGA